MAFTGHQQGEKRMSIPNLDGVWFGTGRADGSVLLRRHGKVSRKDAITDIILRKNNPVPGNSKFTIHVHVLGHEEALVLDSLSELSVMARDGRLLACFAKRQLVKRAPRGWDAVVA